MTSLCICYPLSVLILVSISHFDHLLWNKWSKFCRNNYVRSSRHELAGAVMVMIYGCWIYNYLCNQCLLSLMLWARILFRRSVLDTTLCDNIYQWVSLGTLVSSTNKTDCHDKTEISLKVVLNTITPPPWAGMKFGMNLNWLNFDY